MKKIFLVIAAAVLSAAAAVAQDMATATETYNSGAESLQMGDNATALAFFEEALTMGEACGEDGAELVNNCKDIIPKVTLAAAKDMIQTEDYTNALTQLQNAIDKAQAFGNNPEVVTEATELIPQIYMQKGNMLINAKDYAGAAEAYNQTIALDPDNGNAYLRLGMAYGAAGKVAEATEAYTAAMQHGQESAAAKQLSTLYVKLSASYLKSKKYEEAIEAALKSNEYVENATAMQVAGTAASQLQRNADAVKYLESYLALAPNAKNANQMCYTIAVLAQGLGDKAKACGYYQKITGDPKFGPTAKQQITALGCN